MSEKDEAVKPWIESLVDRAASAITVIETQRTAIRILAEKVGELAMYIEDSGADSVEQGYIDGLRDYLTGIAKAEVNVNELLEVLRDHEVLRRLL